MNEKNFDKIIMCKNNLQMNNIIVLLTFLFHALQSTQAAQGSLRVVSYEGHETDSAEVQGFCEADSNLFETGRRLAAGVGKGKESGHGRLSKAEEKMRSEYKTGSKEAEGWQSRYALIIVSPKLSLRFSKAPPIHLHGQQDFGMVQSSKTSKMLDHSQNDQDICEENLQVRAKGKLEESSLMVQVLSGSEQDCRTTCHWSSKKALHSGTSTSLFQNLIYYDLLELLAVKRQYYGFLRKVKLSRKFRTKFIINMDEIPTYFLSQSFN